MGLGEGGGLYREEAVFCFQHFLFWAHCDTTFVVLGYQDELTASSTQSSGFYTLDKVLESGKKY
jgi:hypothetical protein